MSPTWRVAALYRFAPISDPAALRDRLAARAEVLDACGTLLIAREGINGTIAGRDGAVEALVEAIQVEPGLETLELKWSEAASAPFHRMKVRLKAEIVTMGVADIDPLTDVGAYVEPEDWNALIADPDTLLMDTRNDYEGEIGAFERAVQPNTRTFRDFPTWFRDEGQALLAGRDGPKRVAMYCTGGIRCEKATAFLKAEGVEEVFHLKGGILKYLETVPEPESLWQGECFVFDERVAVGHGLAEGTHALCRACRMPVSPQQARSPLFVEGVACPRCAAEQTEKKRAARAERHRQAALAEARGEGHLGAAADRRQREARRERQARREASAAPDGVASPAKSA